MNVGWEVAADDGFRRVVARGGAAIELKADFDDERSEVVGTEFIGTSITSAGDGDDLPSAGEVFLKANPHLRFFNGQRGYLRRCLRCSSGC